MTEIPWGLLLTVGVPALVSIGSAVWATKAARRAQSAEHEAQRLRALEDRVAEKKFELYQPFLKAIGDMLTPSRSQAGQAGLEDALADFQTFVTAWGSDDAVEKFYRYRLSSNPTPPTMVTMRLMADFLLAVRRDIAWPDTKLGGLHVLGMRINDLAEHPELKHALTVPLSQLFREEKWEPPFDLKADE